jgi:hypothetical protein
VITIRLGTIPARGTSAPWDTARVEIDGTILLVRSRASAVCKLARLLRDQGVPDQPWNAVTRSGKPSVRGRSLHAMAERTISEGDRAGLRWERHREWPAAPAAV